VPEIRPDAILSPSQALLEIGGEHAAPGLSKLLFVKRTPSQLRPRSKSRPQTARGSAAAAKADAAERERIRRMSAVERALLALDLGERFGELAKFRP
jgi:hypothetical protein